MRNSIWLLINEIATKVFAMVTSIYLARYLGAEGFGLFSFAVAIGMYSSIVGDLGVSGGYGAREIAQQRTNASDIIRTLGSVRLVFAVVLVTGFTAYALLIINKPLIQWAIFGAAIIVFAQILSPDWIFRGMERMELIVIMNAVSAIVFLAVILVTVRSATDTKLAVLARSLTMLLGSLAGVFYLWKSMKISLSLTFNVQEWLVHLRESIYFALNTVLATVAIYMPPIVLGMLSTTTEVGLFSAAQKIVLVMHAAAVIIPGASYPTMAQLFVTDRVAYKILHNKIVRYSLLIGIPMTLIAFLIGGDFLMMLLFGKEYAQAGGMLQILIWQPLLVMIRMNYGRTLLCAGKQRMNMFVNGIGASITMLLLIISAPLLSGRGAALSIVVGEATALICMRHMSNKLSCEGLL